MSGGAIIQMLPSLSVRVTSICSKGKDLGKHTVIGSTHLCNSIKLLILTRLPVCHPRLSTRFSILPRTHVWCSGRMSSPLFGIPSIRSPQFPQCPAFSQKLLFRVNLQPPLSRSPPLSPSSTHWISHVLTRLSDTSDCWGPFGPNLPAETLRAQRHPMAVSPKGLIESGTRVAVMLGGWKSR